MPDLVLTVEPGPEGPLLRIAGHLDHTNAHQLRDVVHSLALLPGQLLTLDLAALAFCDSSGVAALLTDRNRAHAEAARIILTNVSPATARVLSMLGLDEILRGRPTPDAA